MFVFFKRIFLCAIGFFVFFSSIAHAEYWNLNIQNKVIAPNETLGILYSELQVVANHQSFVDLSSQSISYHLEIFDNKSSSLGKWVIPATYNDEACFKANEYECILANIPIPLSVVPFSCTGHLRVVQGRKMLAEAKDFGFSTCDRSRAENSYLDLAISNIADENSYVSADISVNSGVTSSKPFTVAAYVLGKNREIIWKKGGVSCG